jgi:Domain of unknown function (DUF4129)
MTNRLLIAFAALPLLGGGDPSPERIRRSLDDVFARREFNPSPSRVDLGQSLTNVFAWLGSLSSSAPGLFWVILIGCLVLLTLLVTHLSWTIHSAFSAARRARQAGEGQQQRRRLSETYATAADQADAAGNYTEAVRCLFLALVYHFDESGRISYLPAGTNREYLREFANRPAILRDLGVFVDILDDNWYGQQPTPPEHYRRCREMFDRIDRLNGEERAAA